MSKISALSLLLLSYGLALPITTARPLSHDRDFVSNVVQLHQHAFPVATTFDQNNVETALPGITEVLAGKTIIDFDIPIAASPATKKQNNVPLFIATDWVEALDSRRSSQTHSTHSETRVNGWYTTCPDGLDACATADGQSWECIDTQNDPTQCKQPVITTFLFIYVTMLPSLEKKQ
ncbi:hypothetical protein EMMF5_003737 [Cystobasidiomycetes sp. EMM_F5]